MVIVDRERVGLDLFGRHEERVGDELLTDLEALVRERLELGHDVRTVDECLAARQAEAYLVPRPRRRAGRGNELANPRRSS